MAKFKFRGQNEEELARLRTSSENYSWGSGAVAGLTHKFLSVPAIKSFKVGNRILHVRSRQLTKLGKVGMVGAGGLAIAATVQNIRGASGIGDGLVRQFIGNPLRRVGGSVGTKIAVNAAGHATRKGVAKVAAKIKKPTMKSPGGFEMKDVTPNRAQVIFRRIRGRLVAFRPKGAGPKKPKGNGPWLVK